eukprot:COSAG06_NODE_2512_length_6739_cov_4.703163_3_plen_164_part_00
MREPTGCLPPDRLGLLVLHSRCSLATTLVKSHTNLHFATQLTLQGYYFVSACLNNLFLFIALWPLIKLQYPDMRIHQASFARDRRVRRAFHYAWVSVVAGILYGLLYKWKGKPSWSLGVCEHAMSIFVALSFAQTLGAFMRSGEEAATGGRGTALQASLLLTP